MKIPIWIKQPVVQIVIYVLLYELLLRVLKHYELVRLDLNTGISLKYSFYIFLLFSFILLILLFFQKKARLRYTIILLTSYLIFSLIFFGLASRLVILMLVIAIVSFLCSHFICNTKKDN